jgi:hypothetical protein
VTDASVIAFFKGILAAGFTEPTLELSIPSDGIFKMNLRAQYHGDDLDVARLITLKEIRYARFSVTDEMLKELTTNIISYVLPGAKP